MITPKSRYAGIEQVQTSKSDGGFATIVKWRQIPSPEVTESHRVRGADRVDGIAYDQYNDATQFWMVGDGNLDLDVNDLVSQSGRVIQVPK